MRRERVSCSKDMLISAAIVAAQWRSAAATTEIESRRYLRVACTLPLLAHRLKRVEKVKIDY